MAAIYIHVPFCKSRCIYCDFYSTTQGETWKSRYVSALIREMDRRKDELSHARVHSIYIGGGTPSQLSSAHLFLIFDALYRNFSISSDAEVTLEANPDDLTHEWLTALHHTPVNRISMGVQALNDNLLRILRRRHTAKDALLAIESCRAHGYSNISVDLIYGLPGQTLSMWESDVSEILRLKVPHLSAYSLSFEEGTPLHRMLLQNKVQECDEELALKMFRYLIASTHAAGMQHYEISNFCAPNSYSRHNHGYWTGVPYLGMGPGAHSYDGQSTRRWNLPDLNTYIASSPDVPFDFECLSEIERYNEFVMTRLRTCEGANLSLLKPDDRAFCLRQAESYLSTGQLLLKGDILSLSSDGIFISNAIMSDLMREVEV